MSSQFNEIADIPREFLREGTQFMNRCAKPDKREFIKISQAVGIGFVVMGAIGYVVKLIHIPVNNILVGEITIARRRHENRKSWDVGTIKSA
ncbi:MAG: hypothetical protein Q9218_001854 [Villophora microphyllina]